MDAEFYRKVYFVKFCFSSLNFYFYIKKNYELKIYFLAKQFMYTLNKSYHHASRRYAKRGMLLT